MGIMSFRPSRIKVGEQPPLSLSILFIWFYLNGKSWDFQQSPIRVAFISIYFVYLIPREWQIMRFSPILHKGKWAGTFILIYVAYLIPREWQIIRFSTISHKDKWEAAFITIYFAYFILRKCRIMKCSTISHKVGKQLP